MTEHLTSDVADITYIESNLNALCQKPLHFKCGFYLICTQGRALVSTGVQQYALEEQTELIFLTGSLLLLVEASADLKTRILLFPQAVFLKAVLPIDTPYYNYTHEHPCYCHTGDARSQRTWREINLWMDMAQMLFGNDNPQFRQQQAYNYLQSLLMWLFNTIQEKTASKKPYSRKQVLFYQFLQLVREHSAQEHQVAFYADKLCITPRYLNEVIAQHIHGKTPKQLIEEQLTAEIKVLLNAPKLSITEIALYFNFSGQSYLSRFFKKHTGLSPKDYRIRLTMNNC